MHPVVPYSSRRRSDPVYPDLLSGSGGIKFAKNN
jgi:hypothetical protein